MRFWPLAIPAAIGALVLTATGAFAQGYTLFGDAMIVSGDAHSSPNAVQLRSDASPGFGGIDFEVDPGTTFADVMSLGTWYKFEADDSCGGGSPRFQLNVEDPDSADDGNIFVYIGPPPSYTGCPPSVWTNTGDLLEGANPIDTTQLAGGTFYDPYAAALIKYGDYEVTGIQLVADASWFFADAEQTVLIDDTNIDGTIYNYDQPKDMDQCKKGGWQDLEDDEGNSFKNQGDCVSFFATGGKNKGAGD